MGCLVSLLAGISSYGQEGDDKQPNIIVFLVDDMGWQDTSVPFWEEVTANNQKFHTPQMERLAAKGMKFTNAYANSICTPSRVSLMTGMNAARHQVTNWTNYADKVEDRPLFSRDSVFETPDWNAGGLSPEPEIKRTVYAMPLFQLLKDNGYYVIHSGKAHFGAQGTPGEDPKNLGADVNIAGSAAGNPASYLGENRYGNDEEKFGTDNINAIKGLEDYWDTPTFLSKALTVEAIKAMDTALVEKKPFFLYLSHYAVHLPFDKDPRYFQKYSDRGLDDSEAAYAALIEGMDTSLGRVLDYLERRDIEEETVILFISDNGGLSHPARTGEIDTQNYPLRNGKGSLYEGGIREPMLAYWPDVTHPGSSTDQPIAIWDFFPTILEMAGIRSYTTEQEIDGISFAPILKNTISKELENRSLIWHYPNNWGGSEDVRGYSWTSAIRKGEWKLIYLQREGELELYNLKEDISEKRDLLKENPQRSQEMVELLTKKLKEVRAPMPVIRATGQPIPWPDEVYQQKY